MTFYNIIFGILFFAATREVVRNINYSAEFDAAHFLQSLTLMVLVFTDAIFTSHLIEHCKRCYKMPLMMFDLLSFVLLTVALFTLNPTQTNLFEIGAGTLFQNLYWETAFWAVIALYMLSLIFWNERAETYKGLQNGWWRAAQPILCLVFLILALLSFCYPNGSITWLLRYGSALGVIVYFYPYKLQLAMKIDAVV